MPRSVSAHVTRKRSEKFPNLGQLLSLQQRPTPAPTSTPGYRLEPAPESSENFCPWRSCAYAYRRRPGPPSSRSVGTARPRTTVLTWCTSQPPFGISTCKPAIGLSAGSIRVMDPEGRLVLTIRGRAPRPAPWRTRPLSGGAGATRPSRTGTRAGGPQPASQVQGWFASPAHR